MHKIVGEDARMQKDLGRNAKYFDRRRQNAKDSVPYAPASTVGSRGRRQVILEAVGSLGSRQWAPKAGGRHVPSPYAPSTPSTRIDSDSDSDSVLQ